MILYTGGTFGMESGATAQSPLRTPKLSPLALKRRLRERVPELAGLAVCDVDVVLNCDSAHMGPSEWLLLADRIRSKWRSYDGVVVLHGTDTMAYTACALSFLLKPCIKPVVLTGALRPLSALRTDARSNLISAVEIAARGQSRQVNQVTVFFDSHLYQGNRVRKRSASEFWAFESPRARTLAHVGTEIEYVDGKVKRPSLPRLKPRFSEEVALLHVTPGFPAEQVAERLLPVLKGLVLVIFPSATAPTHQSSFIHLLRRAKRMGVPVALVTEGHSEESSGRRAHLGQYEAGQALLSEGGYWAGDMTPECAFVKMALILGQIDGRRHFAKYWASDIAGEGI